MIDFRYHLVSLVAVFLAVALGIVIGTTALNQPILHNVQSQVTSLEKDKRALETRTQDLQAQVKADDAFDQAVAPTLVGGTLTGRRVLLVLTGDQVPGGMVDDLSTMLGEAGASVSGTIRLHPGYTDPGTATKIGNYLTSGSLPAGITPPGSGDVGQRVAAVLAQALMVSSGQHTGTSAATISTVLAGLSALDVLDVQSSSVTPADYAVVLTSGTPDSTQNSTQDATNPTQRLAPLVSLASALDGAGFGAVVAGDTDSAGDAGLVGVIRGTPTVATAVSTVDNADTAAGRISTVLALGRERAGTSGEYGTQPNTQPVPPLVGATP